MMRISRKVGGTVEDDIEPCRKTVTLLSNLLIDDFDIGSVVGGTAKIVTALEVEHVCL